MTGVKENLADIPLGRSGPNGFPDRKWMDQLAEMTVPFNFGGEEQVVPISQSRH
jgi:hypothetical protein